MQLGAADVAIDTVEVLRRDEEAVAFGVLEEHVLVLGAAVVGDRTHLDEPRDTVIAVHDKVARCELQHEGLPGGGTARCAARTARRGGDGAARAARQHRTPALDGAEQFGVGVHVD